MRRGRPHSYFLADGLDIAARGQDFEQHLRTDLGGVGRGVILRGSLDHVVADDVQSGAIGLQDAGVAGSAPEAPTKTAASWRRLP